MSLRPAFRFNSYIPFIYLFLSLHVVHFVTSFLSLQLFFPVRLALPFVSTRPFHCLRPFVATFPFHSLLPSFRFNSFSSRSLLHSLSFQLQGFCSLYIVSFVLNFKVFSSFRYFLPGALTLPSSSCTSSFHFKAILATSFPRFNSYMRFIYLFLSFHAVHFVTSLLSLQLFFPVRLALPFLSTRPFHCLRPFVATFPSIRYSLPFVSTLFHPVRYFFPFVSTIGLLFPIHRFFRFKL